MTPPHEVVWTRSAGGCHSPARPHRADVMRAGRKIGHVSTYVMGVVGYGIAVHLYGMTPRGARCHLDEIEATGGRLVAEMLEGAL